MAEKRAKSMIPKNSPSVKEDTLALHEIRSGGSQEIQDNLPTSFARLFFYAGSFSGNGKCLDTACGEAEAAISGILRGHAG
jgi:hypothetical protein